MLKEKLFIAMIAMKRTKEHGPHTCTDCSQGNYSQGIAAIEKIL